MDSQINFDLKVTTAQTALLEPEIFQETLIENMSAVLLRENKPPCLLGAPTGSGKTFILTRVMANVSAERNVLWFWFVPFATLVAQTLDAIISNSADLSPQLLERGRNQEAAPGQVLISTAQAVARAAARKKGYNHDSDDDKRTLAEFVARARVQGLQIGMVVDEAHIGLAEGTEFGNFANWLSPEILLMATATPKDQRINDFLGSAGKSNFKTFTVSRDDVVSARLNKKFIEAVIYDLRQSAQSVTDLKRTVLRQAWRRNQKLKRDLAAAGIALTPLLLVQVSNGEGTVDEAEQDLIRLCKVPAHAIGKHSSDEPNPSMMAAIANDPTKEVLIFKQSAGTGFDAPRAFVLASTKLVNDPDFAMQFIGRVMRVSHEIRSQYPRTTEILESFNTAYVFLANAEAQKGFESAILATSQVKSQLEGQTEKMVIRKTISGASVITNKSTNQEPLIYDLPLPKTSSSSKTDVQLPSFSAPNLVAQGDLLGDFEEAVDELVVPPSKIKKNTAVRLPKDGNEVSEALGERGIRVYLRRTGLSNLPAALKCERRPIMLGMTEISRSVAARLDISAKHIDDAVKVSQNKLREIERHTELTTRKQHDETVLVVMDSNALAREAVAALRSLPQVEDADIQVILEVISKRLMPHIQLALDEVDDEQFHDELALKKMCLDAAHWICKARSDHLAEAMHAAIAEQAETVDADPLPDAMVFPSSIPLSSSRKNVYGVFPPNTDELSRVEQVLLVDDRTFIKDKTWTFHDSEFITGQYNVSAALNGEELRFAKALDRSDFVAWWHRNPDRKPYSVKLVRGEHKNFFYPDFVVCLEHFPGDEPIIRLIETKQDVKDAARKAKHVPNFYGKVLFLTKDSNRLRWVKDNGSLGTDVELDDLTEVREWLRATRPTTTSV